MDDLAVAAEKVASLMRLLTTTGGLRLKYRITAGAGAVDPDGFERRDIYVECKGPDSDLLLANEGELLRALEHLSAKMLRLEPEDHDRLSFDANGFKAARARALRDAADAALDEVEDTGEPFRFQPMNSRERRMLHLFLRDSGLQTASSGDGPRRFVVLYPEGYRIPPERPERSYANSRGRHDRSDRRSRPSPNRY
ncbi:MAG TPA: R3H domain-containing nucleic acid-binding protein [Acidobacteriaceae bacterium]|jgi:spoIIIJ-associated protein|nr:R3H domain-containing nucleic acid-binding protein [Acidobacteriaceae bacterium]